MIGSLLLSLLFVCSSRALGSVSACPYETLPVSLNTPAYLALRDQMHIQGTYLTDYADQFHGA
jgi:hypothetical protein